MGIAVAEASSLGGCWTGIRLLGLADADDWRVYGCEVMQVDDKTFIVNSLPALTVFTKLANDLMAEHKWLTFTWRIGENRSLDQNALLHVWLTLYAAHLLGKDRKQVTEAELEGMKRIAKKKFYTQFGYPWMLFKPINPFTKQEGQTQYRSSKEYKTGEMYQLLTWLQITAANDGCLLESTGELQKLQRKNEA